MMGKFDFLALGANALSWQNEALVRATLIAARPRCFSLWHTHGNGPYEGFCCRNWFKTAKRGSMFSDWQAQVS